MSEKNFIEDFKGDFKKPDGDPQISNEKLEFMKAKELEDREKTLATPISKGEFEGYGYHLLNQVEMIRKSIQVVLEILITKGIASADELREKETEINNRIKEQQEMIKKCPQRFPKFLDNDLCKRCFLMAEKTCPHKKENVTTIPTDPLPKMSVEDKLKSLIK